MQSEYVTLLGFVAGIITTISLFPQVIKTWKTKKTKDISLAYFSILTLGLFVWFVYGLLINDLPVILTNLVAFVLSTTVFISKLKYK